jgi:hypothetical protein
MSVGRGSRLVIHLLPLAICVAALNVAHAAVATIKTVGRIIEDCNAIAISHSTPPPAWRLFGKPTTSTDYLYVGQPVTDLYALVNVGENLYASKSNDAFAVSLATDRTIKNIIVMGEGLFTQRYIVIGESTLADVTQRYGPPPSTEFGPNKSIMILNYPERGLLFAFVGTKLGDATAKSSKDGEQYAYDPGSTKLESITLKSRGTEPKSGRVCLESFK